MYSGWVASHPRLLTRRVGGGTKTLLLRGAVSNPRPTVVDGHAPVERVVAAVRVEKATVVDLRAGADVVHLEELVGGLHDRVQRYPVPATRLRRERGVDVGA
jgi:hypothetical protein